MAENTILGTNNEIVFANAPSDLEVLRNTLAGLPLGITADGELGVKVIVIGNASASIGNLPTADPHIKGRVWNNAGTPTISNG